jgi:hypothetical protein
MARRAHLIRRRPTGDTVATWCGLTEPAGKPVPLREWGAAPVCGNCTQRLLFAADTNTA